jgi:hypothetical protein
LNGSIDYLRQQDIQVQHCTQRACQLGEGLLFDQLPCEDFTQVVLSLLDPAHKGSRAGRDRHGMSLQHIADMSQQDIGFKWAVDKGGSALAQQPLRVGVPFIDQRDPASPAKLGHVFGERALIAISHLDIDQHQLKLAVFHSIHSIPGVVGLMDIVPGFLEDRCGVVHGIGIALSHQDACGVEVGQEIHDSSMRVGGELLDTFYMDS